MPETTSGENAEGAVKADSENAPGVPADTVPEELKAKIKQEIVQEILPDWNRSKDTEINRVHQTYQRQLEDQQKAFQTFLETVGVEDADKLGEQFERDLKAQRFDAVEKAAREQQAAQAAWDAVVADTAELFGLDVNGDWHKNARDDRELLKIAKARADELQTAKAAENGEPAEGEKKDKSQKIREKVAEGKFDVMGGRVAGGASDSPLDFGLDSRSYYREARKQLSNNK